MNIGNKFRKVSLKDEISLQKNPQSPYFVHDAKWSLRCTSTNKVISNWLILQNSTNENSAYKITDV